MNEALSAVIDGGNSNLSPSVKFFRVARLIPADQEILAVAHGTKVRDALNLMAANDYSQLPVLAGGAVIGVFSHRSLVQNLGTVRRQDDPLDMFVDDLLEDLVFVRPGAEVSQVLKEIERDHAVLVGDEDNLLAVATASDVMRLLWDTTLPFILIRDVELAVRDLIRLACPSRFELIRRIAVALPEQRQESVAEADLEKLTLGDLINVLIQSENFGQCFRHTFGPNRDLVRGLLEPVRLIRNRVFHFVGEASDDEIQTLLGARRWLERKVLMVKARQ